MRYFAPAKTSPVIIARLNEAVNDALQKSEVKQRLFNSGIETVGGTSHAFGEMIAREMAKWGKLIREARLRDD